MPAPRVAPHRTTLAKALAKEKVAQHKRKCATSYREPHLLDEIALKLKAKEKAKINTS